MGMTDAAGQVVEPNAELADAWGFTSGAVVSSGLDGRR